jgi:hypothetical protein
MKSSINLLFSLIVIFLFTSCTGNLSKQQEFEEFVNGQFSDSKKDNKIKKFVLSHYSFANSEGLYFGEQYDTNNVSLFVAPDFQYLSFRLVKKDKDDDYDDGYKVYCTKGDISDSLLKVFENDFHQFATFLWEKQILINQVNLTSKQKLTPQEGQEIAVRLSKRFDYVNANLRAQQLDTVNVNKVISKLCDYVILEAVRIRLKDGSESYIYQADGSFFHSHTDPDMLNALARIEFSNWHNILSGQFESDFIQKCDHQEFRNCNKAHSLNLFILFKGKLYGVDKWKDFL